MGIALKATAKPSSPDLATPDGCAPLKIEPRTGTALVPCRALPVAPPQATDDVAPPTVKASRNSKKKRKKRRRARRTAPVVVGFDGRSAQSMLRNGYRAQLDLLSLADTKASIMISITGMSASVLVASDMLGLGHSRELMLPSAALLATFLIALTFAVLAARPPRRSRRAETERARLEADAVSILHFANISRLSREDYVEMTAEVMTSSERTHRHMIVHLHELGSWLERKFRLLRISYGAFLGGLVVSGLLFLGSGTDPVGMIAAMRGADFTPFAAVHEPSAVVPLADGQALVLEDEATRPMVALRAAPGGGLAERPLGIPGGAPALDDLEGATRKGDYVYAITSHARRTKGARQASRERLARFRVSGDDIVELAVAEGLREAVLARHPALAAAMESRNPKADGFNIEGLAFDATGERLLLGLRAPLVAGDAIVLTVENPAAAFTPDMAWRIGGELIRLDLDGAGIRSIEHIPELNGYLILAGNKGRSEPQRLWYWPQTGTQPPQPARIGAQASFRNGEGLARVVVGGEPRIMIVSDDGDRTRGRPGHYLLAPLASVRIGAGQPHPASKANQR